MVYRIRHPTLRSRSGKLPHGTHSWRSAVGRRQGDAWSKSPSAWMLCWVSRDKLRMPSSWACAVGSNATLTLLLMHRLVELLINRHDNMTQMLYIVRYKNEYILSSHNSNMSDALRQFLLELRNFDKEHYMVAKRSQNNACRDLDLLAQVHHPLSHTLRPLQQFCRHCCILSQPRPQINVVELMKGRWLFDRLSSKTIEEFSAREGHPRRTLVQALVQISVHTSSRQQANHTLSESSKMHRLNSKEPKNWAALFWKRPACWLLKTNGLFQLLHVTRKWEATELARSESKYWFNFFNEFSLTVRSFGYWLKKSGWTAK